MKVVNWSEDKNKLLKKMRKLSFEDVENALLGGNFSTIQEEHFNPEKYPNQKILFVQIGQKICVVPFVENDEEIFYKTLYESDKYTKIFLGSKAK